jgi:heptose I phosphotransferase
MPDQPFECISADNGKVLANPAYLPLLEANSLATFDQVMRLGAGRVMRSVPGRRTVRIELRSASGPVVAYLKRYDPAYLSVKRLARRLLRLPGSQDEAMHEWRMVHVLRAHGILTAIPIAAGQVKVWGVSTSSFVMTAEICGAAGDEYVRSVDAHQRRQIIKPLADLTRRFHRQGFIHKDYYLGHIFVVPDREKPELFLIDLQRVLGPARFSERWLVKDLGSLAYSARKNGASRADLLQFYKLYSEKPRLNQSDKRFIQKIVRRVSWLYGRTPKYGEIPTG